MYLTWTPVLHHQMADIFPVPIQIASKDWQREIGFHYYQCRCSTRTIFGPIGFIHFMTIATYGKCSPCGHNSSLQKAATEVAQWTTNNKMALNYDKTKELRICFKRSPLDIPPLTINDRPIKQVKSTRLLGVKLTADLKC